MVRMGLRVASPPAFVPQAGASIFVAAAAKTVDAAGEERIHALASAATGGAGTTCSTALRAVFGSHRSQIGAILKN